MGTRVIGTNVSFRPNDIRSRRTYEMFEFRLFAVRHRVLINYVLLTATGRTENVRVQTRRYSLNTVTVVRLFFLLLIFYFIFLFETDSRTRIRVSQEKIRTLCARQRLYFIMIFIISLLSSWLFYCYNCYYIITCVLYAFFSAAAVFPSFFFTCYSPFRLAFVRIPLSLKNQQRNNVNDPRSSSHPPRPPRARRAAIDFTRCAHQTQLHTIAIYM